MLGTMPGTELGRGEWVWLLVAVVTGCPEALVPPSSEL